MLSCSNFSRQIEMNAVDNLCRLAGGGKGEPQVEDRCTASVDYDVYIVPGNLSRWAMGPGDLKALVKEKIALTPGYGLEKGDTACRAR